MITVEAALPCIDCKATGGNICKDRIIEVASLVIEPNDVPVSIASFSLLC